MDAIGALGHLLLTIVVAFVILTALVAAHEWGHYLVARWCGMRVNAFAIFMGGVRKTDLTPWLRKPLAPAAFVWSVFGLALAMLVAGEIAHIVPLSLVGLASAGVAVPLWAMFRLGVLYHQPRGYVVRTWLKALAVGALVLLVGTKLQGVSVEMVVGVAAGATWIALMVLYYSPIQAREPEDDKQGFGEVSVRNLETRETERVPVRFRPVWFRTGKDGTEYSLLLLPLGGFAAIHGMHPKPDGSEVRIPGGFYSRPPWQRLAALTAGPAFSVLFGLVVLTGTYLAYGQEVPDNRPIIADVGKKSGAEAVGLMPGDEILEIDGERVTDFYSITVFVRDNWREGANGKREGVPTTVTFRRDGKVSSVVVVPSVDEGPELVRKPDLTLGDEEAVQARLGVLFGTKFVSLSLGGAFKEAVSAPFEMVKDLGKTFGSLVFHPSRAADRVAGPTAMAEFTSAAVQKGPYQVFVYAGLLSISLGVMNLLPIVPLDGGQMLVAFVELLRGGRRLSFSIQNMLANSGIALLVLMMLAVSAVDLGRRAEANKSTVEQPKATKP